MQSYWNPLYNVELFFFSFLFLSSPISQPAFCDIWKKRKENTPRVPKTTGSVSIPTDHPRTAKKKQTSRALVQERANKRQKG